MNINEIVQQLKHERSRLNGAITSLEGAGGRGKRRGRPPGSTRRTLSAAARKRISQAMKALGRTPEEETEVDWVCVTPPIEIDGTPAE